MLSRSDYPRSFVDECRARIDARIATYDALLASRSADDGVARTFEPVFFHAMVQVLENSFMHRSRGQEKKDGNPLNEVRMLAASLIAGDHLLEDRSIKMKPERTVLGYRVGDDIRIGREDFVKHAAAFFADLETEFVVEDAALPAGAQA